MERAVFKTVERRVLSPAFNPSMASLPALSKPGLSLSNSFVTFGRSP